MTTTLSLNLADTYVLRYPPGSWVPRPDPQDPDLHCPTAEEVGLATLMRRAADAGPEPAIDLGVLMPEPQPYAGEVEATETQKGWFCRGRRRVAPRLALSPWACVLLGVGLTIGVQSAAFVGAVLGGAIR